MKIIFLDIDGVLNSVDSMKRAGKHSFNDNPDPEHIKWLNLIIKKTDAKIVISSTWRKGCSHLYLWRLLDLLGFKGSIIGSTPDTGDIRGNEIRCWIDRYMNGRDWRVKLEDHENGPIESFVILDDDSDLGELLPFLVKCKNERGLNEAEALKAIKILNKKALKR